MNRDSRNLELSQQILEALRRRGPIKQVCNGEYRTKCLWPRKHKHGDAHPSLDFNPEKGAVCRVPACGYKAGLVALARDLGIDPAVAEKVRRFETVKEAMEALAQQRKLRPETISRFQIEADIKRQAWRYPLPSGHLRWKAFDSKAAPKKYWHQRGTPNQLYGLDEVPQGAEEVFIANGEPAVWVCYQAGVPGICGVYGEGHLPGEALTRLLGKGVKKIIIVPDLDEPGRRAALFDFNDFLDDSALKHLDPSDDVEFQVLQLPQELGEGADLADLYVWCGGNDEQFHKALANLPHLSLQEFDEPKQVNSGNSDPIAALMLFHDQHNEPYAAFDNDSRRHILKVTTTPFRRWLAYELYSTEGKMPGDEKMRRYLRVLEGRACFEGDLMPLHVRVAWHNGSIYYDLGDWRVVRITPDGWEMIEEPPILFRHFTHQVPQVEPQRGGSLEELDCFINITSPAQQLLVHIYIPTALVPDIPHPILVSYGDQGSGKSLLFRLLKKLIDPSVLETTSPPDNLREFVQLASHHLVLFLDNLTSLPDWLSDAFSRLSTGEGLSKRMLYTDDDDVVYALKRLGGINGINLVVSKPDILDRCLIFTLERIPQERRKAERKLWTEFEEARPRLLGAIFDTLSGAMREFANIKPRYLSRMADFTEWGCAAARTLGCGEDAFLSAYKENLDEQNEAALESSPVAIAVRSFMQDKQSWQGSPSELLKGLGNLAEKAGIDARSRLWPKDARWLGRRLREVRPNLTQDGIAVDDGKPGGKRYIALRRIGENHANLATDAMPDTSSKSAQGGKNDDNKSDDATNVATRHQIEEQIESDKSGDSGIKFLLSSGEEKRKDHVFLLSSGRQITYEEAVAIWKGEGAPVVHLGPGENCFDLKRLLLSQSPTRPCHLEVIARWLEQHVH